MGARIATCSRFSVLETIYDGFEFIRDILILIFDTILFLRLI